MEGVKKLADIHIHKNIFSNLSCNNIVLLKLSLMGGSLSCPKVKSLFKRSYIVATYSCVLLNTSSSHLIVGVVDTCLQ